MFPEVLLQNISFLGKPNLSFRLFLMPPKVSDEEVQELLTLLQNVQQSGADPSTLPGPLQVR